MRVRDCFLAAAAFVVAAGGARGATYLPISDAELADRSPVIVRGLVVSRSARLERIDGQDLPFTLTDVQVLESLRGPAEGPVLRLRVPGGKIGGSVWMVPGAPLFQDGQEVVLLLRPAEGRPGEYHLSEFGLSRFDLVRDESGRLFAVRPAFDPDEDLYLSKRTAALLERSPASPPAPQRDGQSFLAALRALGSGLGLPEVALARPSGALAGAGVSARREWINLGGVEPGDSPLCPVPQCLYRWFWDTGSSPTATVSVTGTQSLLSDGSNGLAHVQNAVTQWHTGVPATDVRLAGISDGGNVSVNLDATSSNDLGATWSSPLPCGTGGTIGVGTPGPSLGPMPFKTDNTYYRPVSGTVSMRQRTGSAGCYDAAIFRWSVMHELGHVLGLGHPDQGASIHSTTTQTDWNAAVMHSSIPPAKPSTPQADDIQAIQYYYGTSSATCIPNATTLCLDNNRFSVTVAWTSMTQSGQGQGVALTPDTGYFWFFSSTNVELVVKVLDGCGINAHQWVFAGGLTNINVTITVVDTQTGAMKVYVNALNSPFQPQQDTNAFTSCP